MMGTFLRMSSGTTATNPPVVRREKVERRSTVAKRCAAVVLAAAAMATAPRLEAQFEYYYGDASALVDEWAYDMDATSDGGFIMVGARFSAGVTEVYAVKTDRVGQMQWDRTYRLNPAPLTTTTGYSVDETFDPFGNPSGYAITGSVSGFIGGVMSQDALLLKIDGVGALQWSRAWDGSSFGSNNADAGQSVQQTNDRGFIVAGWANYRTQADCFNPLSHVGGDMLLTKTNANGLTQWSAVVSHGPLFIPAGQFAYRMLRAQSVQQTTPDNGYIVAGYHHDPLAVPCQVLPAVNERMYALRLVPPGGPPAIAWSNTYPDPMGIADRGNCVRQVSDGFIIVGATQRATKDVYVVKTNTAGAVMWAKAYDAGGNDEGYTIRENGSRFVIAGTSTGAGGADALVMEITSNGGLIAAKLQGDLGTDEARAVRPVEHGRYVAAGFTDSYGGVGNYDLYMFDTDLEACEHCPGDDVPMTVSDVATFAHQEPVTISSAQPKTWSIVAADVSVLDQEICSTCQDLTAPTFQKHYNGWRVDFGTGGIPTAGGAGYAVVGYTHNSFDPGEDADALLMNLDPDGGIIWARELYTGISITQTDDRNDPGNRLEHGYAVAQTGDGFIVAGDIYYRNTTRDTNGLLIKVDQNGATQWAKSYGRQNEGEHDLWKSIHKTFDGGYIVAGYSNSRFAPTTPAGYNFYVMKTDASGNVGGPNTWAYTYGGDRDDFAYHIEMTDDNDDGIINNTDDDGDGIAEDGYIVVGYSNSSNDVINGGVDDDIYVVKLRADGTREWDAYYATGGEGQFYEDLGFWITEVDDNDVDSRRDDGYAIAGHTTFGGNGIASVYLLRIADNGTRIWDKKLEGDVNLDATAMSISQAIDKGFIVAGYTWSGFTPGLVDQSLLIKVDLCGNPQWSKEYPQTAMPADADHAASAFQTGDGGYVVFGTTCSFVHPGKADVHVAKTNCLGQLCNSEDLEWTAIEPECRVDVPEHEPLEAEVIAELTHGTEDYFEETEICRVEGQVVPVQIQSIRQEETSGETSDAPSISAVPGAGETGLRAVPTPVRLGERFVLQSPIPLGASVEIVIGNTAGEVVERRTVSGEGEPDLSVSTLGWAPGAYVVRVTVGEKVIGTARVVVVE